MKKKLFALLTVLSAGLLVSCGKSDSSMESEKVNVEIFQFKVEFKDQFTDLAKEYMKTHENVNINITTVGGGADYGAALKAKFVSGDEPTIFNIGGPQDVKDWESKLEDLKEASVAKLAIPSLLKGVTLNGSIYGVPYNQEGYGLIYNKEIFKKAGIDASKVKTYDELLKAVKLLDSKKDELGLNAVFAFPAKETWVTGLHLSNVFITEEFGGDIMKTFEAKNIEFKYKDQFKNVLDLQNNYSVQPTASLDYSQQVEKLFSLGKVAMIQQGNWAFGSINGVDSELAKNIGMLPIPVKGVAEGKLAVGVPMYWAVNKEKNAKEKDAAKDFLNWMYSSKEGKKYVVNEFKFIPAYKGYENEKIVDPLSMEVYKYSNKGDTLNWVFMGYPSSWGMNVLGAQIQKYVTGNATFDEVIKEAQNAWSSDRK
ncbi:ABC transporter substrate-binding protein [Oceanivirga miroungae]|uniref:Family 1 extracellular solute-binding protein n=1 Tax=Oceanivirga miroungae TaxID=1130046 RepID=A0A6I8MD15_9FUSO|nr:ABC transporter substrate-binding protein [Oceanivirga miroungae]VWL84988.1 family 1 extracellular solute-binding protein [Oceanivirga miroungae]